LCSGASAIFNETKLEMHCIKIKNMTLPWLEDRSAGFQAVLGAIIDEYAVVR
jgi:hypothetical protein